MLRLRVEASDLDAVALEPALVALRSGEVVACPTDTLYGLAVDPRNPTAVQRLFAIKGRSSERAVPLVAADYAQVVARLGVLPPIADRLARAFWPGPLSLVIPSVAAIAPQVHAGTGSVAVRVPKHAVTRMLARLFDYPLTASSANLHGRPPTSQADEVAATLGDHVTVLVDSGPSPGGAPSTIVDVTVSPIRLVRAGAVPWERVLRFVGEQ